MTSLLVAGVIASSIGVVVYTWIQARDKLPFLDQPGGGLLIAVDADGVTVVVPVRRRRVVVWSEAVGLTIRTTDAGPFADDVFWEVELTNGESLSFSNDSPAISAFLDVAPEHMPGFDHEAVIDAMASTGNATFLVWRRSEGEAAADR